MGWTEPAGCVEITLQHRRSAVRIYTPRSAVNENILRTHIDFLGVSRAESLVLRPPLRATFERRSGPIEYRAGCRPR